MSLPKKLHKKLEHRKTNNALRQLGGTNGLVDFSSNDYLGFAKSEHIFNSTHNYLIENRLKQNGATGSRLLSGNHSLYKDLETQLCQFHNSEAALIFNSGYDANIGLLSSIPQRGDIILYDELVHASIRDGISMSNAKSYKFTHNDLKDLQCHLERLAYQRLVRRTGSREVSSSNSELYVITESVFSMDGDSPNIKALVELCNIYNAHVIIDEAHAIGVFGKGLVTTPVFAKIITFGKAMGCHGAAVLGSVDLKTYLINFSRPFIYTTGLSPHAIATIKKAYDELKNDTIQVQKLKDNIIFFTSEITRLKLQELFISSYSAIHCCIISGNNKVKQISSQFQDKGFEVKPILSPTVPEGKERLRFCLHSYNSESEISEVLSLLANFVL